MLCVIALRYLCLILMLKRLTVWLLIFAVFAANFSAAFVYVGFKANESYIAKTLCINRFNPGLHCNGRCYFMQKIKQAEENEKKQGAKGHSSRVEISFFQQPFSISFLEPALSGEDKPNFSSLDYLYTSHYLNSVFRPPKSLV